MGLGATVLGEAAGGSALEVDVSLPSSPGPSVERCLTIALVGVAVDHVALGEAVETLPSFFAPPEGDEEEEGQQDGVGGTDRFVAGSSIVSLESSIQEEGDDGGGGGN